MNELELKQENTALRKQNKNLKMLLEEALTIIRKMKDFIDAQPAAAGQSRTPAARPRKKRAAPSDKAQKPAKSPAAKRKHP